MSAHRFLTEAMSRCEPSRPCPQSCQCARVVCALKKIATVIDGSIVSASGPCPMFIDERAWRLRAPQMKGEEVQKEYPKAQFGPKGVKTVRIYELVAQAGEAGISMGELMAATGWPSLHIGGLLHNMTGRYGQRRVLIRAEKVHGTIARYFLATTPEKAVQAAVKLESDRFKALARIRHAEKKKARQNAYHARKRAANADAIAAKQALREKAKKDAAERKALEAQQRAQRLALRKTMKAEAAMNNHLARKMRGTTRGIVKVEEKPAPSEDWSRAHVTVAPRPIGRWEVDPETVPKIFRAPPLGQYLSEAA